MKRKLILTCQAPDCNNSFETNRSDKVTCSPKCYALLWRRGKRIEEPLAEFCGLPGCSEVINRIRKKGRPQLYCSDEHMKRHHYIKQHSDPNEATCMNSRCPGTITFIKSHGSQKFCCSECRTEYNNDKKKPIIKVEKVYKYKLDCAYCGKEFSTDRKHSLFCNNSCKTTFSKQHRIKEWVNRDITFNEDSKLSKKIPGEVFVNCTFNNFSFSGSDLTKVRFVNCNLKYVDFEKCVINGVRFINCKWEEESFFDGALIIDTKLNADHCDITDIMKSGLTLSQARINQKVILKNRKENCYNV